MPIRLPRWLALGIVLAGCGTKEDKPRLDFSDVGFALYLPKAMQQALDSLAPGFRYVRSAEYRADVREAAAAEGGGTAQALFAVVGDLPSQFDRHLPQGIRKRLQANAAEWWSRIRAAGQKQ